jgi:hypothetical protein
MTDRRLPPLSVLVAAADAALHPWVRDHVPEADRRAALAEELVFPLETQARDMAYAAAFAKSAPQSGQPAAAYLDRWVELAPDASVLIGPRYLGLDPNLPFVAVSGSDRPLAPADRDRIAAVARAEFAAFAPGFAMVVTADPIGAWPDTRPELRQVVGFLGDLRRNETPAELTTGPRGDTDFYDRYLAIHAAQVARDPAHARRARCEARDDLQRLADLGTLFDVRVDGAWAGIVAGEPDARRGVRGATVVELILDHGVRGRGYGRHLSTLLAKALPLPDEALLLGTIHADNVPAYRAALSAGRVDVGGEIVIPL